MIARTHRSGLSPLQLITVPAGTGSGAPSAADIVPLASTLGFAVGPISDAPSSKRTTLVDAALDAMYVSSRPTASLTTLLWESSRNRNQPTKPDHEAARDSHVTGAYSCDDCDEAFDEAIAGELGQLPKHSVRQSNSFGRAKTQH